ncbi:MAG: exopolyphosphatase [Novosphingobium sp.]
MKDDSRRGESHWRGQRAVIDIGSNTVRLVIYGGPPRAPNVLYNEKVTAKLGKAIPADGRMSDKAMNNALAALARFAALLRLKGIGQIDTVATAAARNAANGPEFLERVAALGLDPRLLSGEEEALTSAMGVIGAFPQAKGVVADLGGGSIELIHVDGMQCEHGASMPLGTLQLPQLRAAGAAKFSRRMQKVVKASDWQCADGEALYLVGGAHRALGRYAMRWLDWPLDDPHGFDVAPDILAKVLRSLRRGRLPADLAGFSASRIAGLPDTGALLAVLLREINPDRVVFSSWGLREGVLFRSYNAALQQQHPLPAGVAAFAAGMGCQPSVAVMMVGWTGEAQFPASDAREHLRLAATMLALSSMHVEPNLRAEEALNWALRKRWIGIDATGRAMLAAAAQGNGGKTAISPDLLRLASEATLREALAWGLAVRLCRRLTGSSAEALSDSSLARRGGRLILSVLESRKVLCTDMAARDLRVLADWLGLEPEIRFPANARELLLGP